MDSKNRERIKNIRQKILKGKNLTSSDLLRARGNLEYFKDIVFVKRK